SHTRRYPGSQPIHIQWLRHLVGNPAEWRNSRRDHRQRDRISHYTAQRRRRRPHHLTRGYSITQSVKRLAYAAGIRGADYARRDGESVGLLERNYTLSPVKQADGRFTAPIQSSTLQLFNSSTLQLFNSSILSHNAVLPAIHKVYNKSNSKPKTETQPVFPSQAHHHAEVK